MPEKLDWTGCLISVQPRIRLTRSFDARHHIYLGYALHIRGRIGDERRHFSVGVGRAAHDKHQFEVGQDITGQAKPVSDQNLEPVEFYQASGLRVETRQEGDTEPPPGVGVPPALEFYRSRGHRRLATKTYGTSCSSCIWGCRMPVVLIVDHWNSQQRQHRFERFCYRPKSCAIYRPGPTRKVPGRRGMSWEEEDWVDAEGTAHRGPDD